MYAQMDEKTGETIQIFEPIPLPALNVRGWLKKGVFVVNSVYILMLKSAWAII